MAALLAALLFISEKILEEDTLMSSHHPEGNLSRLEQLNGVRVQNVKQTRRFLGCKLGMDRGNGNRVPLAISARMSRSSKSARRRKIIDSLSRRTRARSSSGSLSSNRLDS